jgi:hypothetical protein
MPLLAKPLLTGTCTTCVIMSSPLYGSITMHLDSDSQCVRQQCNGGRRGGEGGGGGITNDATDADAYHHLPIYCERGWRGV